MSETRIFCKSDAKYLVFSVYHVIFIHSSTSTFFHICNNTINIKRKRTKKEQKPEIEIKMAKHKPGKSAPTEYTTDDEDMLMYDVEEELEPDPTDKFAFKECSTNFSKGYLRSLTPTRFRKSRN
ncbi:hypothetical protein TNCV_3966081 [Trichonephila clavipes]|nr:hypothetical protein TNCV_3966081 [Trichonephila clavipes]